MTSNLRKEPSILNLLVRLRADLGEDAFDIVDYWDGDLAAIGLACPYNHRVLAYVSTYDQPQGVYSYELELPPTNGDVEYTVAGRSSACTYAELLEVLSSHWRSS